MHCKWIPRGLLIHFRYLGNLQKHNGMLYRFSHADGFGCDVFVSCATVGGCAPIELCIGCSGSCRSVRVRWCVLSRAGLVRGVHFGLETSHLVNQQLRARNLQYFYNRIMAPKSQCVMQNNVEYCEYCRWMKLHFAFQFVLF